MALLSESVQLGNEAAEAVEGVHGAKSQQQQQQHQHAGMHEFASASEATCITTGKHVQHNNEVMSQQHDHVGMQDPASASEATCDTTGTHVWQELQQSQQHEHEGMQGLTLSSNMIGNTVGTKDQQELQRKLSDQLHQHALSRSEILDGNEHSIQEQSLFATKHIGQATEHTRSSLPFKSLSQEGIGSRSEDKPLCLSDSGKQSRPSRSSARDQQQALEQLMLGPDSHWSDVEKIFGPGDQAIIHTRGADGSFGPTTVHGYPGIVFEVTRAGCLAAATLLQI